MRISYVRREPDRTERAAATLVAAGVGVAAGLAAFYVLRLLVFRDELPLDPPGPEEGEDRQ